MRIDGIISEFGECGNRFLKEIVNNSEHQIEFGMRLPRLPSVISRNARLRFSLKFVVERFQLKPTYLKNKARILTSL